MVTEQALKKLLAENFDKKEADINGATKVSDLVSSHSKLVRYLNDNLGTDLAESDIQDAETFDDLLKAIK
ncbi:hypothetical protein [Pseudomonas putida]|uniref:hypothetical protein n=1 Tax=Pseudomonas putida TaxID=303 RepID=UPI0008190245|nr:hypothetical protein [Pseudomonas putida]OCT20682.1 hypothetical protein A6E24_18535 [Pseudomonas putida]OCT22777.1 hypothetical protein A6E20_15595 [Pseudomonas putida]OCT29378.1 hypothetical protein A6E23_07160 [Pseudomonas putida]OCT39729.1 hypothetical protein A6E19_09285 [Pseudomonas putida]